MHPPERRGARAYVLPGTVDSNIPLLERFGDCGAWQVARHILIELACALHAKPLRLRYQELERRAGRVPIGIRITAHVQSDTGRRVIVIYRSESAPAGPRGDYWSLTVNGLLAADGTSNHPAPHQIAVLIRHALAH